MPDTIYICDKHACKKCNSNSSAGQNHCKHTTQLKHAIHKDETYGYFEVWSEGTRVVLSELSKKDREKLKEKNNE